ncbi:hypothetical protein FM102_14410 [Corynebacterium glutamicum]|nr:hypothetical protein FM102_14410 [Corynebacterium glutamicum]
MAKLSKNNFIQPWMKGGGEAKKQGKIPLCYPRGRSRCFYSSIHIEKRP